MPVDGENIRLAPSTQHEKTIRNKQVELLAGALNTAATSCFTVGIATPIAGYMYNVGGLQASLPFLVLMLGIVVWVGVAVSLHILAKRILRGLLP